MIYALFILSIGLIVAGHVVKSMRQKQFSDIYEEVELPEFAKGLAASYLVNLILPFRLGDLLRSFILGRKMKNGFSFAFATVVVDRILDIIVVGMIYLILYLSNPASNTDVRESAIFYIILSAAAILAIACVTLMKRGVKKGIRLFTGIFNERIELKLMFFFWSIITAFRDIAVKIKKSRLAFMTMLMWGLYIASYYLLSLTLTMNGVETSLMSIFSLLFSSSSMDTGTIAKGTLWITMYHVLSSLILMVYGVAGSRESLKDKPEQTLMLLPQLHESDRRAFLENYFEGDRSAYVRGYLEANSDIQIISDHSAGSDATTLLAIRNGQTVFRKYVIGAGAEKLKDQMDWIRANREVLPLPEIIFMRREDNMSLYDMPSVTGATGFFEYIHTNPVEQSLEILKRVLSDLEENLYVLDTRKPERAVIERYIDEKVAANIEKLWACHEINELARYDELVINGRRVAGMKHLLKLMDKDRLLRIFADDKISRIHGDVTVENIITVPPYVSEKGYYLIDPNTGNILDSKFIDIAKILQSIHGGYEFLMRTERCRVSGNEITFISGMSDAYRELHKAFDAHIRERYTEDEVKSIYSHEIINWLRLMPYKIEQDQDRAVIFFAGMLLCADSLVN